MKTQRIHALLAAWLLLAAVAGPVAGDPATVSAADTHAAAGSEALANRETAQEDAPTLPQGDYFVYLPLAASPGAAAAGTITLNGDSITASATGVTVAGTTATITAAGTYTLSGTLDDGQIVIDSGDEDVVTLVLAGATIANRSSAAIYAANAKDVILVLAAGSTNAASDGATYVFADPAEDEPNAAIFSKADLTITGSGSLSVQGNCKDGIATKDELQIEGGALTVNAADDGVRGKDSVVVQAGSLAITAGGDGVKSDDEEDPEKGFVTVEDGTLTIVAAGDAITAQTDVTVAGGTLTLTSGGGSSATLAADASAKGIKAGGDLALSGGTFAINAADDALHAGGNVTISGGTYTLATGAIHITRAYEGLESNLITLNGGDIRVVSSDDAVNIPGAGDNTGPAVTPSGYWLVINGGYLAVNAGGDGLDANGSIAMAGGVVIVHGPTQNMNGAIDYDGAFNMTGGVLLAAGSAGMAQAPSASSTQNSLLVNFNTTLAAGTLVHLQDSAGNSLLTFAPAKQYQSLAFSSPQLATGGTYSVYLGGSAVGPAIDGVYSGAYTPGQQYTRFTVTGTVTKVGGGGTRP